MIARDQTFEDITVCLDGSSFYGCTFRRCKLQLSALLPNFLVGCNFDNCTWEFGGPAANTVAFMTALYRAVRVISYMGRFGPFVVNKQPVQLLCGLNSSTPSEIDYARGQQQPYESEGLPQRRNFKMRHYRLQGVC